MRVDPSGVQPASVRPAPGTPARSADKSSGPAAAPAEGFAPTGELTRLLTAVKDTPEVRADVVANVAARLAAGEFDSPQAAADTAQALLDSGG